MTELTYLDAPEYKRDPKVFMRGYNSVAKGTPNPYVIGGEWYESWEAGRTWATKYIEAAKTEGLRQIEELHRVAAERRHVRTEKQKRNKANRVKRAPEQAAQQRQRK